MQTISRRALFAILIVVLWAIGLIPVVGCGGWMIAEIHGNNRRLETFAEPLFHYPLPAEIEEVSRAARVGLMVGNGNHCDFLARRMLRTRLSRTEISRHFATARVPAISTNSPAASTGTIPIAIEFDEERDGWLYFSIEAIDFGHSAFLDPRCW